MSNVLILADFVSGSTTKTNAELATAGVRIGEVTAVALLPLQKKVQRWLRVNKGPVTKVVVVESDAFVNNGVAAVADVLAQNNRCAITCCGLDRITCIWQRGCCSHSG